MDIDDGKSPDRKKQCCSGADEELNDNAAQAGISSTELDDEIGREEASLTEATTSDETDRYIRAIPATVAKPKPKPRTFFSRRITCLKENCLGCTRLTPAPAREPQRVSSVTNTSNITPPSLQLHHPNMPQPPRWICAATPANNNGTHLSSASSPRDHYLPSHQHQSTQYRNTQHPQQGILANSPANTTGTQPPRGTPIPIGRYPPPRPTHHMQHQQPGLSATTSANTTSAHPSSSTSIPRDRHLPSRPYYLQHMQHPQPGFTVPAPGGNCAPPFQPSIPTNLYRHPQSLQQYNPHVYPGPLVRDPAASIQSTPHLQAPRYDQLPQRRQSSSHSVSQGACIKSTKQNPRQVGKQKDPAAAWVTVKLFPVDLKHPSRGTAIAAARDKIALYLKEQSPIPIKKKEVWKAYPAQYKEDGDGGYSQKHQCTYGHLGDCNAAYREFYTHNSRHIQLQWYTQGSAHGIQSGPTFLNDQEHMSFKHIRANEANTKTTVLPIEMMEFIERKAYENGDIACACREARERI